MNYFGEPWPSGVCDDGTRVPAPVGEDCVLCETPIEVDHQGSFMHELGGGLRGVHRECNLRSVVGGIGHLRDHARWCVREHDPDGGLSYRESALAVWQEYAA